MYCPYTDCDIPEATATLEHIIPLSLGGSNAFRIPVDGAVNSRVGSDLDGALSKEFLWALARSKHDARGHSGKEPWAEIKQATYGEESRPAQVRMHMKHGVRLWDAIDREDKSGRSTITLQTKLDLTLPVRFTAKVALGAGYYVYGDLFRDRVDHAQLRAVMLAADPMSLDPDETTLTCDTHLLEPQEEDITILALRAFCSSVDGTVVALLPGYGCFGVAVGLLGRYLAFVNVPAETQGFPNRDDYSWGHVVHISDRQIKRFSWTDGLHAWLQGEDALGELLERPIP